jgi:hypothetical protein
MLTLKTAMISFPPTAAHCSWHCRARFYDAWTFGLFSNNLSNQVTAASPSLSLRQPNGYAEQHSEGLQVSDSVEKDCCCDAEISVIQSV